MTAAPAPEPSKPVPSLLGIRPEDWAFPLMVGAICGALTLLGIALTTGPERVAAIWPMNAFVVALLVRRDRTVWPGLLAAAALGNVIVNLYTGDSWPVAVALCAANVLEIFACAYAFERLAGTRAEIAEPRPLLLFLGIALAAPALPALLSRNRAYIDRGRVILRDPLAMVCRRRSRPAGLYPSSAGD